MYKKSFFIVFEGIEGSGKSYQAKLLYNKLKKKFKNVLLTREPGGTKSAEVIRKIILKDYFEKNKKIKFDKYTDTLLYLAARNEHLKNKIIPAIKNKKIIICDRFVDSTLAYQVYGKKVSFNFINRTIIPHYLPNSLIRKCAGINHAFGTVKKHSFNIKTALTPKMEIITLSFFWRH